MPSFDAVIFCNDPPAFYIDETGLVHISQSCGQSFAIERVMRLNTFLKTLHLAKEALHEYERRGTAQVVPFPKAGNGAH